jgi:hypothetical protein
LAARSGRRTKVVDYLVPDDVSPVTSSTTYTCCREMVSSSIKLVCKILHSGFGNFARSKLPVIPFWEFEKCRTS